MTLIVGNRTMLLAGLLAIAGCSLALDLDERIPCSSDADCEYAAGPGSCNDGFCRPPSGATGETDGTSTGTATMTSVTVAMTMSGDPTTVTTPSTTGPDTMTTEDSSSTGEPVDCEFNTDCTMDQRCGSEGVCVNLLSAECQEVQWPDVRDNVVFLGS